MLATSRQSSLVTPMKSITAAAGRAIQSPTRFHPIGASGAAAAEPTPRVSVLPRAAQVAQVSTSAAVVANSQDQPVDWKDSPRRGSTTVG